MPETPADLRYTQDHEWVRVDGDDIVVGITDHAQEQLGDVVYVDLPPEGATVEGGASFGEVESTKSVSDLFAPVAGTIAARNEQLDDTPELLNSDPYGDGWLVRITPRDMGALDELLDADAYGELTS